ncbi:MAG: hypothetical protein EOP48_28025, partial [Sphingobacteriales bacterium]
MKYFKKLQLNYKTLWVLLIFSLAFIVLFGSIPPFNHWTFRFKDLSSEKFSNYGEFIGGLLGTLLSLASFFLLFKSLIDQKNQFVKNSFENNFYSLLENHRNILLAISDKVFEYDDKEVTGPDFFADLAERISIDFEEKDRKVYVKVDGKSKWKKIPPLCKARATNPSQKLVEIYSYYFHIFQSDLGHYFRSLYH